MKALQKITLFLFALSLSLALFWACKRTVAKDEVLGSPTMKSAPSDFSGITNSPGILAYVGSYTNDLGFPVLLPSVKVSFGAKQYVYLNNAFSHEVSWFLTFRGEKSGAVKKYSGTGSQITIKELIWDGEAESKFFVKDENVNYNLTFLGSSISYTGTFQINDRSSSPKSYKSGIAKVNLNGDTICTYCEVDNFEASGGIKTSYSDAGDGTSKAVFYVRDKQGISDKSIDGYLSYYMTGTDNNGNNYCGGSSGELLTEQQGWSKETDPTKVYINAYIYGYANRKNSALFFQLFENDNATITPSGPGSIFPVRNNAKNDMWYTIVEVNWVGWKLVSIPYASLKAANNPLSGGGGNRIQEPHKLAGLGIELESYPTPGQTVEIGLDQVNLTTRAAFIP